MEDGPSRNSNKFLDILDNRSGEMGPNPAPLRIKTKSAQATRRLKEDAAAKSSLSKIKSDWSVFWRALFSIERITEEPRFKTLAQIREYKKSLSTTRKLLHERLESLQKEIERLSGLPTADITCSQRLLELNDLGQKISEELTRIPVRLSWANEQEDLLKSSTITNQELNTNV